MNDTNDAGGEAPVLEAVMLRDLERLGSRRMLSAGEVLVRQGDTSELVYLVVSGALEATVTRARTDVAVTGYTAKGVPRSRRPRQVAVANSRPLSAEP